MNSDTIRYIIHNSCMIFEIEIDWTIRPWNRSWVKIGKCFLKEFKQQLEFNSTNCFPFVIRLKGKFRTNLKKNKYFHYSSTNGTSNKITHEQTRVIINRKHRCYNDFILSYHCITLCTLIHGIKCYSPPRETRVRPRCARCPSDHPIQNANVSRGTGTDNSTGHQICWPDGACHCPRRKLHCGRCWPAHHLPCACPREGVAGSGRRGAWTVPGSPAIDVCPCGTATNPDWSDPRTRDLRTPRSIKRNVERDFRAIFDFNRKELADRG